MRLSLKLLSLRFDDRNYSVWINLPVLISSIQFPSSCLGDWYHLCWKATGSREEVTTELAVNGDVLPVQSSDTQPTATVEDHYFMSGGLSNVPEGSAFGMGTVDELLVFDDSSISCSQLYRQGLK